MVKPPPAPADRVRLSPRSARPVILKVPKSERYAKPKRDGASPVFYHTGDLGDIVAALSAMKALGGGRLQLGPDIGFPMDLGRPRIPGSPAVVENVYDLFMLQPYIESVEYREKQEFVNYNFNLFRTWMQDHQGWKNWHEHRDLSGYHSLASAQQALFNVHLPHTTPWLEVDVPWPCDGKPIVIQRSPRYHNDPDTFPWGKIVEKYGQLMVFIGHESEHEEFCSKYGKIPYLWCGNVLRLARIIAGSNLFIGNQSSPFWFAEGLKVNLILEGWVGDPNCEFDRPGHHTVFDADWPHVDRLIKRYLA